MYVHTYRVEPMQSTVGTMNEYPHAILWYIQYSATHTACTYTRIYMHLLSNVHKPVVSGGVTFP